MADKDFKNMYCMHDVCCGELRANDIDRDVTLCG